MTRKPAKTVSGKVTPGAGKLVAKTPAARAKAIAAAKAKGSGVVVVQDAKGRIRSTLTFGGAVLQSTKSSKKISNETLEQSRAAMRELAGRILKPGVDIPVRQDVPKFYVDEADPKLIVRELNGKRERGRFEGGQFKAVA